MTLTKPDLGAIKILVEEVIEEKTESVLATKDDLKHLPTKDDFYGKMDEVMGELQAIREEHTVSSGQVSDHEDRITLLEEKTGLAPT